ncbi:UNVERIFIED_CONTAM: hypothetical protein FKN15_019130 [Acipenser sinensis]
MCIIAPNMTAANQTSVPQGKLFDYLVRFQTYVVADMTKKRKGDELSSTGPRFCRDPLLS